MFYGSGAGSLPTASAVVGDVIDAVKHLSRTLFVFWDSEELKLVDNGSAERAFFIRVPVEKLSDARTRFESKDEIRSDEIKDEAALITAVMSENEFERKFAEAGYVISRIRINK